MLTKEEKHLLLRYQMLMTLRASVDIGDIDALQKLHELTSINTNQLVRRLSEPRIITAPPQGTLFTDLAYLIFLEAEKKPEILEAFYAIYSRKYTDIIDKLQKAERQYLRDHTAYDKLFGLKMIQQHGDSPRTYFTIFLLLRSAVIEDISIYRMEEKEMLEASIISCEGVDNPRNDSRYKFASGEEIFSSAAFAEFYKRKIAELTQTACEHLAVTVNQPEDLAKKLEEVLKSTEEDDRKYDSYYPDGVVTGCARDLLCAKVYTPRWYDYVTVDNEKYTHPKLRHSPNMEEIILIYYKNVVKTEYFHYHQLHNGKDMPAEHLSSGKLYTSPMVDLYSVMFMYNLDVYCKLFTSSLEHYYQNFSWEKIAKKEIEIRHSKAVQLLEQQLSVYAKTIDKLTAQNSMLQTQINSRIGSDAIPYERTISKLQGEIEEQENEIADLKAQLLSKEQFIELLSAAEDIQVDDTIDVNYLKTKRYLFVGRTSEVAPQLKKDFPNSLFMEHEGFSLQNIKVDGIVMLIKGMSHAMFYKVNATASLDTIPIARCNTRNISTIYQAMARMKL